MEIGASRTPVNAEYEASSSGEIIYTRTLKDGNMFLSVERRPSVDSAGNAVTTQKTGEPISKIEGVKRTDLLFLPGVERFEERYGHPCIGVEYPGGRNGDASRNADMLMFAEQWGFRIHVSAASEADMDKEQIMKWFSDLRLTKRKVPDYVALAYTGENFQGAKWEISEAGDYDLNDTFGLPNDSIRSLKVLPGSAITLYEHATFEGKSLKLEAGSWSAQASSLKAVSGGDGKPELLQHVSGPAGGITVYALAPEPRVVLGLDLGE